MATKKVKSDTEKLDDAHMEHVIKMLEPSDGYKPWTKKDACGYLGITYNTTRLGTLIEKYKERKAADAQRRAEKRGKPATDAEITYIISSYLEGATIDSISSSLYRSATFIRSVLDRFSVPIRNQSHSYFRPGLVPEAAMRERFSVGEVVYSMRYDSLAKIKSEFKPGVYHMYLLAEKQQQFAYQPSEELASLEHLKPYVNF